MATTTKARSTKAEPTKPRYAAYLRISRDRDGTSTAPKRQLAQIRMHAKLHDYEVAEIFEDADLSAYRDVHRPAYEEMLAAMEEGAFDGIVVWKLDRLIRRISEFSRFWKIAEDSKTALVSVTDSHIDTRQPIGVGFIYLLVSLAEQEAHVMGMRIRAKEVEMAGEGRRHPGGRRPYGVDKDHNVVEAEAKVIREAAERALAGENLGHIARDFNKRGIPTASGKRWGRRTLHVLLQQARLFGWREYKGELTAKGDWEPIISEADGRRLRELLPKMTPRGQGEATKRVHLLSGLLKCAICGRGLRGGQHSDARDGKGNVVRRANYRCPPTSEGGCGRTVISKERADVAITEMVLMRLDSPVVRKALQARSKKGTSDAKVLAELQRYSTKREELAEQYADDEIDAAGYKAGLAVLERRMADLNERLAKSVEAQPLADLLKAKNGLQQAWDDLSAERRRAVIEVMLEKVLVHQVGSDFYAKHIRQSLLEEADELEEAGDVALATRRRTQAENPKAAGNQFRPERLEPIWRG